MNVIVTNNLTDYNGFIKLKTLKEALEVVGKIDFLVYHKSNETRENKVEYLTKLKANVSTFVYIRGKDALEQAVQMVVVGSGGKYFDDEFFLESSAELNRLIKSLDEVTAIAELGGVNVLSDFFNKYLKNGSSGFNKSYLSVVKEAVSSMISEYKQKDLELLQLSETATEIFANSADIISKVESERENLKSMVSTLESARNQGRFAQVNTTSSLTQNIVFFPKVTYLKEKTIIRVKELGSCTYLTSFMLGFKHYLETMKYLRVKLIVIEPVGEQYMELYKDFTWVTQENSKTMGAYYESIVFTNYPNREVLNKLLDDTGFETFIVLDRLKTSKEHILNSKGSSVKYCVSGENSMIKCGAKPTSCFSVKPIKNTLFSIPTLKNYPRDVQGRQRMYLKECSTQYETLNITRR